MSTTAENLTPLVGRKLDTSTTGSGSRPRLPSPATGGGRGVRRARLGGGPPPLPPGGVEIDRPARPARRNGAKSDELDAARAAREALSREHLAQPRRRGDREAIRVLLTTRHGAVVSRTRAVCHLRALLVSAPEQLRNRFRHLRTDEQLTRCARLRTSPAQSAEHRCTIMALRSTARRALGLQAEADDLETEIERLVVQVAPGLLAEPGVGAISAAQILCSWSHAGRLRSEAAFAALAGAAPVPASSGQTCVTA